MAHDIAHHESNTKKIWQVFFLLSAITIVEVIFGIWKPGFMEVKFLSLKLLNWFFIILTLWKAYYITWSFMHMEGETKGLRRSVVWTGVFLICYLMFILLTEGDYIYEVFKAGHKSWDF